MRGKITNRDRAMQIRDFSGLRWGNITPTDIDGLIEYHNKCYIVMEAKANGAELPYGQKLALTRMIDDCNKPSILFLCSHDTPIGTDIDMATTMVSELYFNGKWETIKPKPLKYMIDLFIDKYGESPPAINPIHAAGRSKMKQKSVSETAGNDV